MDTIAISVIGLIAAGYIARLVWREVQGKSQCHCSSGCGSSCHKEEK